MFSHVMVGANDLEASRRFYDSMLGVLGVPPGSQDSKGRYWWRTDRGIFGLTSPLNGEAATGANGGTIGFAGKDAETVNAAHQAGLHAGGATCEDPPGRRQNDFGPLHLAYLRDPSGNKICLLHRITE